MIYHNLKKKINYLRIIVFILISCVLIKLAYAQLVEYKNINLRATESWERSFPIEASRGYIFDQNMEILASNIPTMSVVIIPYQINNPEEVATSLAKILKVEKDKIYQKITKRASIIRLSPEGRQIQISEL